MLRPTRRLTAGLAVLLAGAVLHPLTGAAVAATSAPAPRPAVGHDHRSHDHGSHDHRSHDHGEAPEEHCQAVRDGAVLCAHADAPPPGVDVRRLPSTRELQQRPGAAATAVTAAQTTGVPTPAQYAAGSTVPCDGDGTSGSRVQAMYVVAADRPNRFAALQASIQTWAAGVEDVVNRSAAQTGGVRHVRYVTGPASSGACTPTVLNVTVPAGGNASFSSTIAAVQGLGHTDPNRKYLMWVDAASLCGIASMYLDDRAGQDNANNGRYAQYARVDSGCWGHPNSVEAHELVHNLGGVQRSAPNSTAAGHCTDDADRMCYSDGAGVTMRPVCPPANEALLDCRNDDYFLAAVPPLNSYLATHWNTADSRFLIGGAGGGGSNGPPTGLSVAVAVDNPGIAGLPTQVTATTQDVPGRQPTVAWTVSRRDCTVADPTAQQTTVTCSAGSSAAALVTVTAGNGVTAPVKATSPLTFSTTARAATLSSAVDGTSGPGPVSACPRAVLPVTATMVDAASGSPVRGVRVQFLQTLAGRTTVVGTATTAADGTASGRVVAVHGAAVTARTAAAGAFASRSSEATTVHAAAACATGVDAALEADTVGHGDPARVTGRLQRTIDGSAGPVAGARVSLVLTPTGTSTSSVIATATTGVDGSFRLVGTPRSSGVLVVRYAVTPSYQASASAPLAVTVQPWTTAVTTSLSAAATGAGQPLVVTGSLTRTAVDRTGPAPRRPVVVQQLDAAGRLVRRVSVTTGADGAYTVTLRPLVSGSVVVASPAAAGYSASTGAAQSFTVTA